MNKPFHAALVAIYVNGLAGTLAYKQAGLHIIATDLIDNLPLAMKQFDKVRHT
jgi:ADP-dependent NAD(P)H-hydrate dehydratase